MNNINSMGYLILLGLFALGWPLLAAKDRVRCARHIAAPSVGEQFDLSVQIDEHSEDLDIMKTWFYKAESQLAFLFDMPQVDGVKNLLKEASKRTEITRALVRDIESSCKQRWIDATRWEGYRGELPINYATVSYIVYALQFMVEIEHGILYENLKKINGNVEGTRFAASEYSEEGGAALSLAKHLGFKPVSREWARTLAKKLSDNSRLGPTFTSFLRTYYSRKVSDYRQNFSFFVMCLRDLSEF